MFSCQLLSAAVSSRQEWSTSSLLPVSTSSLLVNQFVATLSTPFHGYQNRCNALDTGSWLPEPLQCFGHHLARFFFCSASRADSVQTFGLQNVSFSISRRSVPKALLRNFEVFFNHVLSTSPKRVVYRRRFFENFCYFWNIFWVHIHQPNVCTEDADQKKLANYNDQPRRRRAACVLKTPKIAGNETIIVF